MIEPPPPPFVAPSFEPSPAPPRSAFWLLHLFFRPRVFFEYFPSMATRYSTIYASLAYGVSEAIDTIARQALKQDLTGAQGTSTFLLESWSTYWVACLVTGAVTACFLYVIGGWWYRKRIEWSGAVAPDKTLARRVYVFSALVLSLPYILYTIGKSFRYATPLAAEQADGSGGLVLLLFIFWSLFVSHRGVRTVFSVSRWKARFWFILAPVGVYLTVLSLVLGVLFLAATGVLEVPPNTQSPRVIDRPGFTLQYPGNWSIDTSDEDYSPDEYFSIDPIQDAVVQFFLSNESSDPGAVTRSFLEYYEEDFTAASATDFHQWGLYRGVGTALDGTIGNEPFRLQIFTTSREMQTLTVVELTSLSVAQTVEPGFELIRRSFHFKE